MIHLSKRLSSIAAFVDQDERIADIGTDHAFLPIALVQSGKVEHALACDVAPGPLQIAASNIAEAGLQAAIETRLADGLQGIKPEDEIGTVIIAGMGGELIEKILEAGQGHLDGTENMILSPHRDVPLVRRWLAAHEFGIMDEQILEDEGHVYEIMLAGHTVPDVPYTEADFEFGPILRAKREPLFVQELQRRERALHRVAAGLSSASGDVAAKRAAVTKELELVRGELND
ncbi:tRNA (adenine(22)-N(1))-methyltransferase [Lacticaseibacillus zhaodongensis]|uniref:tRNA (adenine(22)-N(1))-methyltransferase n=1 Tax=Lacticaseibacillus zhaodongensis TaxID=2668065 RepID=UPI0012D2B63B|nr:class I SAM-dependent methyltransferase [Lacticaseibacillus zhaodongensis]